MIIDAIGALSLTKDYLKQVTDAGGEIYWYHPFRWNTWPRINNRTHRELLVIDGTVGFIGGAGLADHWYKSSDKDPRWRDTMVRVEGGAVTGLQAVFAENWLESSGEILTGYDYFPFRQVRQSTTAMVVGSAPTTGRSTTARVLFQMLLASAKKSIHITTPYFLPDNSARAELVKAVEAWRGHADRCAGPSQRSLHDPPLEPRVLRRLLEAGAKIYEYQPSMIHTKSLIVDGMWGVVGSTNFDSRSFGINDEVNLAVLDPAFAQRLESDFDNDVKQSKEITFEQWKNRPHIERAHEFVGASSNVSSSRRQSPQAVSPCRSPGTSHRSADR